MNNDLQNALKKLETYVNEQALTTRISRREAQALLEERDALLTVLRWIATEGHPNGCATACGDIARAALAKASV